MTLDDMIAQRDALLAARFRGVRTSQRSTLSSTISARNLPCSAVMWPTVMGRRKRRGPALPGLKKSVPFFQPLPHPDIRSFSHDLKSNIQVSM
jgi:hypothetical protein